MDAAYTFVWVCGGIDQVGSTLDDLAIEGGKFRGTVGVICKIAWSAHFRSGGMGAQGGFTSLETLQALEEIARSVLAHIVVSGDKVKINKGELEKLR